MAATFTPDYEVTEIEVSPADGGRRRKITKFALAGVAVLGVGAALTSAAWSDDVWFQGEATTGSFALQGYDPTTGAWEDADDSGAAIVLPADAFNNVGPGIADSYTVSVRNNGSVNLTLAEPSFTLAGDLFSDDEPAGVTAPGTYVESIAQDGVLVPGEQATREIVVTGHADWTGEEYMGSEGTVTVEIEAASAP